MTLVGVARGVGRVTLERLHGTAWRRVGDVRVRGDGGFARRVRASRNATYRLRAAHADERLGFRARRYRTSLSATARRPIASRPAKATTAMLTASASR